MSHTIALQFEDGVTRFISCNPNEKLSDAAYRQKVNIPLDCRDGACGTCRGLCESGSYDMPPDSYIDDALEEKDARAGYVLACQMRPTSDCVVRIPATSAACKTGVGDFPATVASVEQLSPSTIRFALALDQPDQLDFLPGQYVNVIAAGGLRRAYSLANAPRVDNKLELMIREVEGGAMSAYWFGTAQAKDLLRIEGPRGTFFLRDTAGADLIFLATGTGIAPIRAFLTELEGLPTEAQPRSITLLWGGRHPADLFWQPPEMPGLRYVPVLSRADADWTGARGHVQDVLLAEKPDLSRAQVYACGSQAMILSANQQLCAAGLPANSFYSDAFVASE